MNINWSAVAWLLTTLAVIGFFLLIFLAATKDYSRKTEVMEKCPKTELVYYWKGRARPIYDCTGVDLKE